MTLECILPAITEVAELVSWKYFITCTVFREFLFHKNCFSVASKYMYMLVLLLYPINNER